MMAKDNSEILALAKMLKDPQKLQEIGSSVVRDAIQRIYDQTVGGESWTKVWPEHTKKIETRERDVREKDTNVDRIIKEVQFSEEERKVLKDLKISD
jgi:hypothetical protein